MNEQEAERPVKSDLVEITKIWHTIQGEGPYCGMPAIFVRLAGCNLQCPLCDTDYTSTRKSFTVEEAIAKIKEACSLNNAILVVFTGGEPFRQASLLPIIEGLSWGKYLLQIETNGTLYERVPDSVLVVCSPKTQKINSRIHNRTNIAFKYVIRAGEVSEDGFPTKVMGSSRNVARPPGWLPRSRIYMQPLDEGDHLKNKTNVDETVKTCLKHGYRLSLQMHKIVGLE